MINLNTIQPTDLSDIIDEIRDLRAALAARLMTGEQMSLREAVRTELIGEGAEAAAQVDAVRTLHSPIQQGRVYCSYIGPDRPECSTCFAQDGGLLGGHERTICGHFQPVRSFSFADEPAWPCETVQVLDQGSGQEASK